VTEVEFFFDPSCPWTWVTSRWLATVAPHRGLEVTWRTWSLPMKNEDREPPDHLPAELKARIRAGQAFSVGALRVLEAAAAGPDHEAIGRLYTEMGRQVHADHGDYAGFSMAEALAAAGVPGDLAAAAGDDRWDQGTRDNMAEAAKEIGDDVGVPIVAVRVDGTLHAMAGPIMGEVPPLDRALDLWDAVATIVTEPSVFELKRNRTGGPHPPAIDSDGRAERD